MRIVALILVIASLAATPVLQSPKGKELFPRLAIVQVPARMTILASNRIDRVSLAWTPSPGTNVAGYYVYYGRLSRFYDFKISANTTNHGKILIHTNMTIGGLHALTTNGITYYFTATAYDTAGLESDYSNEISTLIPYGIDSIILNWTPAATNTILASTDLKSWRVLTNTYPPLMIPRTKLIEFYRLRVP